jgi:hypothetical protein
MASGFISFWTIKTIAEIEVGGSCREGMTFSPELKKKGLSREIISAVRKRDRVAEGAPLLREYGV